MAPLLVGALVGSMIAGRLETAALCIAVALGAGLVAGARLPARRWIVTLATSVTLAWLLNLYLVPGEPLPSLPPLFGRTATRDGLHLGGLLTLRMLGAFTAVQGLRAAWPGERAADAAARVLAPLRRFGVPIGELRLMVAMALRFAPLLAEEGRRIERVQTLRAGRPARTLRERFERRRAATVPAMVGALERAERVALALEARHVRLRPLAPPAPTRWVTPMTVAALLLIGVAALWRG
jgi:energy-coupling factor transporter transmembrane protein EcfT